MHRTELIFPELPYYLKVYKVTDHSKDLVKVEVRSKIHVNSLVTLGDSWTTDYLTTRPREFRSTVLARIVSRYGLTCNPVSYS